jgi:hypothetical protein
MVNQLHSGIEVCSRYNVASSNLDRCCVLKAMHPHVPLGRHFTAVPVGARGVDDVAISQKIRIFVLIITISELVSALELTMAVFACGNGVITSRYAHSARPTNHESCCSGPHTSTAQTMAGPPTMKTYPSDTFAATVPWGLPW